MSLNVANKKVIRRISFQSMKTAKTRNIVAILAIALTTLLFTALFTIAMSISYSFEQSNFKQAGGYSHGTFKYLTEEQLDQLKDDPLIQSYGCRLMLGMVTEEPFNKTQVEVSCCDEQEADFYFLHPGKGHLPKEGTKEAATDTRVLSLLGIEPEIGTEFTLTIDVDGVPVTETFTLCGYWEYDEAIPVSHVLLPEDLVKDILAKTERPNPSGYIGVWYLDVMFDNSYHIEKDMKTVLSHYGYQADDSSQTEDYLAIGVNWGYVGAQLNGNMDPLTALSIAALLLLIIFTGYLIIYNVFQISVSNDIRFYGLLKTIGTTGRQIKHMVFHQAVLLSVIGIPIGLLLGYGVGALLFPVILSTLDAISSTDLSFSPLIFVVAVLFALITVMISCRKPGKMAAKVSPIEAVRYTERTTSAKTRRKSAAGASISKMALANLGRNRKKTVITVLSLSLAVVLLNLTVTFTNGFDMDKYLSYFISNDFTLADASYMNSSHWSGDALPEEAITAVTQAGGIAEGGRTYGHVSKIYELVTEEQLRASYAGYPTETVDSVVAGTGKVDNLFLQGAQVYGMEPFCLDGVIVLDGDLSKLYEDGNYIAAVYETDDYGNPEWDSNRAKIGDKVRLCYPEECEFYNPDTGVVYENPDPENDYYVVRPTKYQNAEYEVAALVAVPNGLSYRYRYLFNDTFILNADTFKRDAGIDTVMYYTFDMEEGAASAMESFLADYTQNTAPQYDYESQSSCAEEFYSFKNMFLIMGSVLSSIIGLIGVLNFLNAILTGILTRHREFAVLQSVGMTGKQLKTMLVIEGLLLALGSVIFSFLFILVTGPLLANVLGSVFWFFTYRFTIFPVLAITPFFALLGALIPLVTYRYSAKKSIVERLREAE